MNIRLRRQGSQSITFGGEETSMQEGSENAHSKSEGKEPATREDALDQSDGKAALHDEAAPDGSKRRQAKADKEAEQLGDFA